MRSFYKYNHEESVYSSSISLMKRRREKQEGENRNNFNIELMKELKGFMGETYKMM